MCAAQLYFGVIIPYLSRRKKGRCKSSAASPSVSFSYLADLSSCRNVLLRLHKDYVALRVLCAEDHAL